MRSFLAIVTFLLTLVAAYPAYANIDVRPFLIDQAVSPREIVSTDVNITNTTGRKLTVYATVNEITVGVDGEVKEFVSPIMSDRTNTITSWIEVSRGRIEINPGESTLVPVTFRIHPQAKPGSYHAFVGFVSTSKRHQAEAVAMAGDADGVVVKLTIEDKVSETLRLKSFSVDRFVINPTENSVVLSVENLGDVPTSPTGEIIFYRSNGDEITAVPVNVDSSVLILPNETADIRVTMPPETLVGRIKANAVLEYGKSRATLYDTTYFYSLPLTYLVVALVALLIIILLLVVVMYRSYRSEPHHQENSELPLYIRTGTDTKETHHDIDLKNTRV